MNNNNEFDGVSYHLILNDEMSVSWPFPLCLKSYFSLNKYFNESYISVNHAFQWIQKFHWTYQFL